MSEEITRPFTFGEDAVGVNFNPSNNRKVEEIKFLYAKIIDILDDMRRSDEQPDRHPEKNRYLSIAITETQTAQMWAVKGITK
jgi:hypothetical protein